MSQKATRAGKADVKELAELKRAIAALKGSQHNPVNFAAITAFLAPIIARIAARYAARYVAGKLNKRLNLKLSREAADVTADRISALVKFKS